MKIAPPLLALYQQLLEFSQSMLRLATEGNWDELIAMEASYVNTVNRVAECTRQYPVPANAQQQLRPILRHILDNEAEVKSLLLARQEQLSTLIGQTIRQKSVNKAYGGMSGVILYPQS